MGVLSSNQDRAWTDVASSGTCNNIVQIVFRAGWIRSAVGVVFSGITTYYHIPGSSVLEEPEI